MQGMHPLLLMHSWHVWQDERYTPVRALVDAVPAKGAQRYDFLRQLLKGMTSPEPAAAKYDPVWDLLHTAKTKGVPGESIPSIPCYARHGSLSDQVSSPWLLSR